MTDTKPTIEEQISALRTGGIINRHAILASLEKLAALEKPVPVEPEFFKNFRAEAVIHTQHGNASEVAELVDYIDALQSALKLAQEERDRLKSYWLAIDNRMVVLHLGTADSFDADTCMNKILEWETTIALDPQVSRPAQELKDTHLQRAEKAESEIAAIRSAELPVEPSLLVSLRNGMSINDNPNILDTECDALLKHIDALKAYALKEKERADGLQKIQDEAESILFSVGDITCANGHKHKRHDGCLYCLAEKAESELTALRGRLMDLDAKDWLDTLADADKAMSAVALKEGE